MDISVLGEFGLIDRVTAPFEVNNKKTVKGIGDDSAVIDCTEDYLLTSCDLLLEGINFDLVYTPLKHLGFKSVVVGCSDILAMNGKPTQIMVAVGVSARFTVENIEEFYEGVKTACEMYGVDLIGGDTSASLTGFTISVTAYGRVAKDKISYRSGAKVTDLICVTGDLGSAYLGTKLLEREKRVLKGNDTAKPEFKGYEYLLERALKPSLRVDVIEALNAASVVPTSMIDISDGLASDVKQICKSSGVGAKIFLERVPIASKSFELCDELNIDPVTAALNGGDDYELMFTVPVSQYETVIKINGVDVVGHITHKDSGEMLVTPDGAEIALKAQGWKEE